MLSASPIVKLRTPVLPSSLNICGLEIVLKVGGSFTGMILIVEVTADERLNCEEPSFTIHDTVLLVPVAVGLSDVELKLTERNAAS